MNKPKLKLLGGIILLAALGFLYGYFLLVMNVTVNGVYDLQLKTAKIKAMSSSVTDVMDLGTFVSMQEMEKYTKRVQLASLASRGFVENDWDGKPTFYSNGVIVTVSGDKVEYPADYPEEMKVDAASLKGECDVVYREIEENEEESSGDDFYVMEYCRVKDNVYYIESERASDLDEKVSISYNMEKSMEAIETAFGIQVLLISQTEDEEGRHPLIYYSDGLPEEHGTAEEFGITKDMLDKAFDSETPVTVEDLEEGIDALQLGDESYNVWIQKIKGSQIPVTEACLAYLIPELQFANMTVEQTVAVLAVFLIIGIVLLVWFFSAFRLIRHYSLSEEQAERFQPGMMIRKAFTIITVGSCVIIAVVALFFSLFRLYDVCNTVEKSLKVLEQRIKESTVQKKTTVNELKDTYSNYAQMIAQVLMESPELATPEAMKEFSELIGADYLMVYDHSGKEILTDSGYIDLVLGTSPDSATYEFRRLLKGIPVVARDAVKDEVTGLTNVMIGVCMKSKDYPEEYGALLVAVPTEKITADNLESTNDIMKSLVSEGTFAFSVNPETQMIMNSSDKGLIGRNAVSLGLPENALTDSYRDFFDFNGMSCYGESKAIDGTIYYYAEDQSHIYKNILLCSLIAAAACFILLAALNGYMLFGYRKGFEYWVKEGEKLGASQEAEDKYKVGLDLIRNAPKEWEQSFSRYGLKTPMHNAVVTLELLLVAGIVLLGIWFAVKGNRTGSLLSFVLYGHWTKGFNLFSFTRILFLFAEVLLVITVLKVILSIISTSLGSKGETYCRLAKNLLTYGKLHLNFFSIYDSARSDRDDLGNLLNKVEYQDDSVFEREEYHYSSDGELALVTRVIYYNNAQIGRAHV